MADHSAVCGMASSPLSGRCGFMRRAGHGQEVDVAVEDKDFDIDDSKSDPNDPLRALDSKLADAPAHIAKGEPARRIALEAERAALSADLLSGRQTLWVIYKEFERDDATTDHIAYGHFERTCRIQNPYISQAGRVGAHGGAAGRSRAELGANRTVGLGNTSPLYPPRDRINVA